MAWGAVLWDQTDALAQHTSKTLDSLEKFANFIKDRAAIEYEYAKQLGSLVRRYQPKKSDTFDNEFTSCLMINKNLMELQCLANQHERLYEDLKELSGVEIQNAHREFREQRKMCVNEIGRLQQTIDASIELLHKAKKDYARAFKEAENAQAKFEKADADRNLSRADVDKAKNHAIHRAQLCEDAKNSYALQLRKTNECQQAHYLQLLPCAIDKLFELDSKRCQSLRDFATKSIEIERKLTPIVETCLRQMRQNCDSVDPQVDCQTLVHRLQTGYKPPEDFQFVELKSGCGSADGSHDDVRSQNSASLNALSRKDRRNSIGRVQSSKKTIIPRFFNRTKDSANGQHHQNDEFSTLPPLQKCNRLHEKIDGLQKHIELIKSQRDGLVKMQQVYKESPNLGDVAQVELEIEKCETELSDLNIQFDRYQTLYSDAKMYLNAGYAQKSSYSTNCNNNENLELFGANHNNHQCSSSIDGSDEAASEKSLYAAKESARSSGISNDTDENEQIYCEYDQSADGQIETEFSSKQSILGQATVIYDYSGESEGTIAIEAGQNLKLLEKDTGDGWTKVRRSIDNFEGFVPTAYLDCHWSSN